MNNGTDDAVTSAKLYEGVLLGMAIGDAPGLSCEGLSQGVIAKRLVDRLFPSTLERCRHNP